MSNNATQKKRYTHQYCIVYGSCARFKFPVEEVAQARVFFQFLRVDLVEVATEGEGVHLEAVWPEPNRELKGVHVAP